MRGGIEVIHDVEARSALRPVDRRHVEEHIEAEFALEPANELEDGSGRDRDLEHAVRHPRLAVGRDECLQDAIADRHAQNLSVRIGCRSPAIRSCSIMIASMTVSGRGGQPGT